MCFNYNCVQNTMRELFCHLKVTFVRREIKSKPIVLQEGHFDYHDASFRASPTEI